MPGPGPGWDRVTSPKFRGIGNNIQPILSGFKATAAFAGPIAILATGANLLYENWDSIAKLWGKGATETEADRMEKLRKAVSLTADEAERLKRATAVTDAVKDLQGARTPDQQAETEAVKKAITIAGVADVARGVLKNAPGLVDAQPDVGIKADEVKKLEKERDEYIANAKKGTTVRGEFIPGQVNPEKVEEFRGKITDAQRALAEQREKTATQLAGTGTLPDLFPGGRKRLAETVRKDPNAFGEGGARLADDLDAADPANARLKGVKDAAEKGFKGFWSNLKEEAAKAAEKTAKEEDKKETEQLNLEAKVNEARWDADLKKAKDSQSFLGKNSDALTPAEKEAKRLDAEDEGPLKRLKQNAPELPNLVSEAIKGVAQQGGNVEQAQQALFGKLAERFGEDAARALVDEGTINARGDLINDAVSGRGEMQNQNVQVLNGNAALRDQLQSAVKSPDEGWKKVAEKLDRVVTILDDRLDNGGLG